MTAQEAILVRDARPDLQLKWYWHPDPRFVYLQGKPCPLLTFEGKKAVCTVHKVRPANCRRFGCMRPDPSTEPYEPEPLDLPKMRLGCANLSDRLTNRKVRKRYQLLQRDAMKWGLKHGWSQDMAGEQVGSNVTFYGLTHTQTRPKSD